MKKLLKTKEKKGKKINEYKIFDTIEEEITDPNYGQKWKKRQETANN